MEEWVGKIWHGLITRSASREFAQARVELAEMRNTLGILLRALGNDAGLQIQRGTERDNTARRSLLQRIAGSGRKISPAWRDAESLRLPDSIAIFPQRELNRDLYLWLTALGAVGLRESGGAEAVLQRYPLLQKRYQRLQAAWRALEPEAGTPSPLELVSAPGVSSTPMPPELAEPAPAEDSDNATTPAESKKRHRAEQTTMPDGKSGLVLFRLESLFSWTDYLPVNRTTDDEPDDDAARAADDMDVITLARDNKPGRSKIKLDLDLPSAEYDDIPVGDGIPLPEWDYRKQLMKANHCRIQTMLPRDVQACPLPVRLKPYARKLQRRFEMLRPQREWLNHQQDGAELDIDSYILHMTERKQGRADIPAVYRDCRERERDLSCLLLADFSMSTDSWVSSQSRVVDIIRDSLMLFAEAMQASRDCFALYGFSSLNRQHVRFYQLKNFREEYDNRVRGRITAMRPGYYTRMGAAIRYASRVLEQQASRQRLLLLLTDGKPNDLDIYESRYGLEDTRMALQQARQGGIQAFCITIDDKAQDYLPRMFGHQGWALVRKAEDLPQKLPQLYALLTGH